MCVVHPWLKLADSILTLILGQWFQVLPARDEYVAIPVSPFDVCGADMTSRGHPDYSLDQLLVWVDRQADRVELFRRELPDHGSGEFKARDAVESQGSLIRL